MKNPGRVWRDRGFLCVNSATKAHSVSRHVSRRGLRLSGALPGRQIARKCRSGKALAATRQNGDKSQAM
jgi:hypothetical protein